MRMNSLIAQQIRKAGARNPLSAALALAASAFLLAGCGLFSGPEPTPTATRRTMAPVPTFTPAPPAAAAQQPAQQQVAQPTDTPLPPPPTDTPAPQQTAARLTVKTDLQSPEVNVRSGPSTGFPPLGVVQRGQQFEISGRNVEGTWYAFTFNGRQGWIYVPLVDVENPQLIALAPNIPATPVPPPPPTATPPPPPAQADPCAGIGGDGCKFRLRNRDFKPNSHELKLYVGFVHGGRNDEVQGIGGSYYVELHKDGAHVSAFDHTTRGGDTTHNGPQGNKYNYLKSVPRSQVPGGNVNGNYTIWVKDGNGERDSQNFTFTVSGDQGEVWLIFDQNN